MTKIIEITAPVGNYETLHSALQAKTDSVYFGIGKLNMRAKSSSNFSIEDLHKIKQITDKQNVKTYLAVNTVIYDSEISAMHKIIDEAKKQKINAIIATDMATMQYAKNIGIPVHLSTQTNVSNLEAVKYYSSFADVIVLARELNLEQVVYITDEIVKQNIIGVSGELIKIEIFVHGALCMAISGKCYLSLHEKNYSANKGKCLQTCRKAYIVKEKETGNELEIDNEYIMSPKDLSTISFIDKIIDSGVSIMKIEGRARSPEYVYTAVKIYKEAIEAVKNNLYSKEKIKYWQNELAEVFNRGFWDGYYLGQTLGEWSEKYGSKATKKKTYIGKATNYFNKIKVGEFIMNADELKLNDEIIIIGPTTGIIKTKVKELRLEYAPVKSVKKGDKFSMPITKKLRPADKLYKIK